MKLLWMWTKHSHKKKKMTRNNSKCSLPLAIMERQIKTTLIFYLSSVSNTKVRKQTLARMWGKGNHHLLLVSLQNSTATLDIHVGTSQKKKKPESQSIIWSCIPLLGKYPNHAAFYYTDTCSAMFIAALVTISRK